MLPPTGYIPLFGLVWIILRHQNFFSPWIEAKIAVTKRHEFDYGRTSMTEAQAAYYREVLGIHSVLLPVTQGAAALEQEELAFVGIGHSEEQRQLFSKIVQAANRPEARSFFWAQWTKDEVNKIRGFKKVLVFKKNGDQSGHWQDYTTHKVMFLPGLENMMGSGDLVKQNKQLVWQRLKEL